jgi:hypothetical protein
MNLESQRYKLLNMTPKKEDTYSSSDIIMVQCLLMLGHRAKVVERGEKGELIYIFDENDVKDHVHQILTGHAEELTVSLADFRRAQDTWTMNLRNIR